MSDKAYNYHVKCTDSMGRFLQIIISTPKKLTHSQAISLGQYEISKDVKWTVVESEVGLPTGLKASHFVIDDPWFKKNL